MEMEMLERKEHQNPTEQSRPIDWRNSFVVGLDKCLSRNHRYSSKSQLVS